MVIVNQDKDWIFNFDNTTSIGIDEDNTLKVISIAGKWNILGSYKTRERAKEILQDILENLNEQRYLLKPKTILKDVSIEDAKEYFEEINNIKLIATDNLFDIESTGNNEIIIYQMPEE